MPGITDRDHFAAAALTGLIHSQDLQAGPVRRELACAMAYRWADAMLRERAKTNHDAAPAARAQDLGTGDTPATHATRGEGSEHRECTEPVAWAVMPSNSDYCVTLSTRKEAAKKAAERKVEVGEYATMDDIVIVPLYRQPQPTLTDAEREAMAVFADSLIIGRITCETIRAMIPPACREV